MTRGAINVRFASRRTAAKFASLFDEAGGVVRDMTEIDRTGEHGLIVGVLARGRKSTE